jgi:hypothetical protein
VECGVVCEFGVVRVAGFGVGGEIVVVSIVDAGWGGTIGVVVLGDVSMCMLWDVNFCGGGGIWKIFVVSVVHFLQLLIFPVVPMSVFYQAKSYFP